METGSGLRTMAATATVLVALSVGGCNRDGIPHGVRDGQHLDEPDSHPEPVVVAADGR